MKEAEMHKHPCDADECPNKGRRLDPNRVKDGIILRPGRGGRIYCEPHFRRLMKYGDPLAGPPVRRGRVNINEGKICSHEGCGNEVHAKGVCLKHWMQEYRAKKSKEKSKEEREYGHLPVGEHMVK